MKLKRFLALLLVLCMILPILPAPVQAAEIVASGDWSVGNTDWELTSDGTLTLSGTRRMQGSSTAEYPWKKYANQITKVVIKGLTSIAMESCSYLKNLTSVVIDDTVKTIERDAFRNCPKLTTITIPANVEKIGNCCFIECTKLKTVKFASNSKLTVIGASAFYWTGLTSIELPKGVTEIGDSAFYECKNLTSVILPEGLEIVLKDTFDGCYNLTHLTIPSTLSTVRSRGFMQCPISHLDLYKNIDEIKVYVDSGVPNKDTLTTVVFHDNMTEVSGLRDSTKLVNVTLPDTIKTIKGGAFMNCTSLTTLEWPRKLETIRGYAFSGSGLVEAELPDTVTMIGEGAFKNSVNLSSIDLGSISRVENECFNGCTNLKTIHWSENVESIGYLAFANCDSLTSVTIPASVKEFEYSVFVGSDNLTEVYFCGDAPGFDVNTFDGVTATVYYPVNNATWTSDVMQDYGGILTWKPYCLPSVGHDYGEYTYNSEEKTHTHTCSVCGNVETEACTFDQESVANAASIDVPGVKLHICSVCGGSYEAPYIYRVSGADRVGTALAAADLLKQTLGVEKFDSIILADGYNFADALPGSYLAAKKNAPILLHHKRGVDRNEAYIRQNLSADGVVYILGGTVAVPASVETSLTAQGYRVVRLAGNTRYDTNLEILKEAGVTDEEILVCTGGDFADSLSASATGLPILLTNYKTGKLTNKQIAFLSDDCANNFTIIGGTKAVSAEIEEQLRSYGEVVRLSGATRYHSSVLVAERFFADPDKATVASGKDFPDGLCGGPLAYNLKAPLLLVDRSKESIAAKYITGNGITGGAILGGPAVVSDASGRIAFGLQ